MTNCPCEGKHSRIWHTNRNLPNCDEVKLQRQLEQSRRRRLLRSRQVEEARDPIVWIPGSPILVDEDEEPSGNWRINDYPKFGNPSTALWALMQEAAERERPVVLESSDDYRMREEESEASFQDSWAM